MKSKGIKPLTFEINTRNSGSSPFDDLKNKENNKINNPINKLGSTPLFSQ